MTTKPPRYVNLPTRPADDCRARVLRLRHLIHKQTGQNVSGPDAIRVALDEAIRARTTKP